MTPRRAGLIYLLVTAVLWGLNWPVIKLVLHDWSPLFARGVSGLVAASGMALVAVLRGDRLAVPRGHVLRLLGAAGINVFAWMGFTTLSLIWLDVAEAALLAYSMPIWATLFAWPLRGERPGGRSVAALALGIIGLAVLMGGPDLAASGGKLPGLLLALAAAFLFAFGTVAAREPIPLPPLVLTAWQVGLGCLPMVVIGLCVERPELRALTRTGFAGLAYMAVGPMAACYLTWFAALRRLPTATAATGLLLVPIVGTLAAALVLGEPLGLKALLAFAITLGGVALALHPRRPKQRLDDPQAIG